MKNNLLAFLIALPAFVCAQTSTQKVLELASGYDAGQVLLPVAGGGYAIFGRQTDAPGAKSDVFYLKVDASGNQLAYKKYGDANTSESVGKGVVTLPNGWLMSGSRTVISPVGWLQRISATGDVLWVKDVPGTARINQMVPMPGGGFLATGQTTNGRMFLMQIGEDGTVVWQQNYTSGEGRDLYITSGGNACIVMGSTQLWKIHLVSKQIQWEQSVAPPPFGPTGNTDFFALTAMVTLGKGQFAVIGSAYTDLITALHSGHYAAVWNETGTPVWQKFVHDRTSPDFDQNEGFSIFYLPNSRNILFAGSDAGQVAITRMDQKGKVVDDVEIAAPGAVFGLTLIKDAGYYVMTGAVLTNSINTWFYRSANNDLSKSAAPSIGMTPETEGFRLLHTPGTTRLTVETHAETDREGFFQLWDTGGKLIWEKNARLVSGENRLEFDTGVLPAGLYWLRDVAAGTPARALLVR